MPRPDADPRLPVTVLPGFLGAGKTTMLNPTERLVRTYGRGNLERVLAWFRQAADALASGAEASTPRQTGP